LKPCVVYFDLDWLADVDDSVAHVRINKVIQRLRVFFRELGREPEFEVTCSSRPKDGMHKGSYHIVVKNFPVAHNQCTMMRMILDKVRLMAAEDDFWLCEKQDAALGVDANGKMRTKTTPIVDYGVYDNDRCMRLTLHRKLAGVSAPLLRMKLVDGVFVSDDAAANDFDSIEPTLCHRNTVDPPPTPRMLQLEKLFMAGGTAAAAAGGSNTVAGGSKIAAAAAGGSGATAGYNNGNRPAATMVRPGELPFDVEEVVRALRSAGDDVSVFSNVKRFEGKTPDEAGGWQVQFKKSTERPCVVECGRTHGSNNVVVMVYEVANSSLSRFRLVAKCFGDICRGSTCQLGMIGGRSAAKRAARSRSPPRQREDDGIVINEDEEDASRGLYRQPMGPLQGEGGSGVSSDPEDEMQVSEEDEDDGDVLLRGKYVHEENTYEIVKARFEKRHFQLDSGGYVKVGWGVKAPIYMSAHQIRDNNQNVFCSVYDKKIKEWVKVVFVVAWMKDPNIKKLYGVEFDPTCTKKRIYNTWPGFLVERLPPIEDKSTIPTLIQLIKYHIDVVIADGDEALATWFHHWMAHLLQLPHTKTGKAVSLYGSQGAGKTILVKWMAEVLMGEGEKGPASITNDAVTDVVGRFATSLVGKVFCMIEEAVDMKIHAEALKDIINGGVLRNEVKCKTKASAQNYANLVFTSNTDDMLPIESDDRRYVLIKISDKHLGDKKYFTALRAHMARPDVQRAFYEYCMGVDLSIYTDGFQNADISTAFYRRMRELNLSPFIRFLGALVKLPCHAEGKEPFHATTHAILALLSSYAKHNGMEAKNKITGVIPLGHKLADFKSITPKKANATVTAVDGRCAKNYGTERTDNRVRGWTFDMVALKTELINSNRFVEDDHTAFP
jgi:energy-coupling factor transporter ATP-binding protein EcfA2